MSLLDKIKSLFSRNKQKLLTDGNEASSITIEGENTKNKFREKIKESAKEDFTNFEGITEEQRYEKVLRALGIPSVFINHPRTREQLFDMVSYGLSDNFLNSRGRNVTESCLEKIKDLKETITINPTDISFSNRRGENITFVTHMDGSIGISHTSVFLGGDYNMYSSFYNMEGLEISKSVINKTSPFTTKKTLIRQSLDSATLIKENSYDNEETKVDLLSYRRKFKEENGYKNTNIKYDIADLPDLDLITTSNYKPEESLDNGFGVIDKYNDNANPEERNTKLKEAIAKSKYSKQCENYLEANENIK